MSKGLTDHPNPRAASYIPGQSKAGDALKPDAKDTHLFHDEGRSGSLGSALKPAGEQTTGEWLENKADQ
jgi:hypothetical protein